MKHLDDGEWYKWRKNDNEHICCKCGMKHRVDLRVDKRGVVWMRWTKKDKAKA